MRLNAWTLWGKLGEFGWGRVLLLAGAAGCAAFVWSQREWLRYRRFQSEGVPVTGWITSKSAGPEKVVYYAYAAGGVVRGGSGKAGIGTPDFELIEPDERVAVYYLPSAPEESLLGAPKEHLRAQNRVLSWALLFFLPALARFVLAEFKRLSGGD